MKLALAFALSVVSLARAELALHPLFSDGAVLQRGQPVPVWGTAEPGAKIEVAFAGQNVSASADAAGNWRATLAPLAPSDESRELRVTGSKTLIVRDVLVGEVWLAGGQSNMDSPMSSGSAAHALPGAADAQLRFFKVTKSVAAEPNPSVKGRWLASTPSDSRDLSAVAYFFAREIRRTQGVPVAILHSAWGGTPIKTWMSLESLQAEPPLAALLKERETALAKHLAAKGKPELMTSYYRDMKEWEETVDAAFREARRNHPAAVAAAQAAGQPPPPAPRHERPEPEMPDPIAMPSASKRPQIPTISYNAMIAPLAPFAMRGVLWYQGEADGSRGADYREWLPRLVSGWRSAFQQAELAFAVVQLPAHGADESPVARTGWPFLREAQATVLTLPHTAMAVTLDIGDPADVHPDNKEFVGERLARAVRAAIYREDVVGSGPRYRDHTTEGASVRIRFSDIAGGLVIGQAPWRPTTATAVPTDRLVGFYIIGENRQWLEAEARIEGDAVVVSHPAIKQPNSVRYGWANSPRVNLYNDAGLPAAPFRLDNWPR